MKKVILYLMMIAVLTSVVTADEIVTEGSKASSYDPDLLTAVFDKLEVRPDGSLELMTNLEKGASIVNIVAGEVTVRGGFVEIRQRNGVKGSFINENLDVDVVTNDDRILLKVNTGKSVDVITTDFLQVEDFSFHCDKEDEKCKLVLTLAEDWNLDVEGKASYVKKEDALSFIGTPEEFKFPEKVDVKNFFDLTSLPIDEKTIYLKGKPLKDSKIAEISLQSDEPVAFRGRFYEGKGLFPDTPLLIMLGKKYDILGMEEGSPTLKLHTSNLPKGSTRINFFESGKLLFSLEEGYVVITENEFVKGICSSCVFKQGNQLLIKADEDPFFGKARPTTLVVYPHAYLLLNQLVVLPFDEEKSRIIVKKEGLPNSMIFSKTNVELTGKASWFDFGFSFITRLYRAKKGIFETLECKLLERKCYVDGVETTGDFSSPRCSTAEDCGSGKVCTGSKCASSPKCGDFIINGPSESKYDLFFVGSGFTDDVTFEKTIRDLLYFYVGADKGLFGYEPFIGTERRFNVLKLLGGAPYPGKGKEEEYLETTAKLRASCPRSDLLVVVVNNNGISYCAGKYGPCVIYTGLDGITAFDRRSFTHEFGHGFADLRDEYYKEYKGYPGAPGINCAISQEQAELFWGKELADAAFVNGWFGCGGGCDKHCTNYLRPSQTSIMRSYLPDEAGVVGFNSISKKEILKILEGYA